MATLEEQRDMYGWSPEYYQTQQDMGAIRDLMATQGSGYMVTGNASMPNGGNSAAWLPGMMHSAGIAPTQGIQNSYQQITGQQWSPGDTVTGYTSTNNGNSGTYNIQNANGQTSNSAPTGYGGFAGQPAFSSGAQSFNTKPLQIGGQQGQQGGGMWGASASGIPQSVGGSFSTNSTSQNPYLAQMGDVMAGQMTQNFNRRVMPQISSGMMAAGGYGGSRQGVIEANAMNDLNQQIGGALTNLYGQGYNTTMQHDLGQQNLGLGYANLDRSINNDNLNWQLQGANFGLGVYDRMQQGNQTGLNAATNIQNTPYNYWQNFSNQANSIGQGYGTQTQSTGGNPLMGALGGAQLGNQAANWWSSQSGNNAQPYNPATAGAMAASLNANGYWPG